MRIVVSGLGIVSALGIGKEENQRVLLGESSGVHQPFIFHTSHTDYPLGEVKKTDAELKQMLHIAPEQALSRSVLLASLACREALTEAKIPFLGQSQATEEGSLTCREALTEASWHNPLFEVSDMALVSGTTVGGIDNTEQQWAERANHALDIIQQHSVGTCTKNIAAVIGHFGYVTSPSTACSSAMNAVIMACNLLRAGKFTKVLAGGTESLSRFHFNGFLSLQILSRRLCRPFCATRDGLNLGEGAAYLLLETEESALERGANIWCYIGGYGNACDAFHQTASSAEGIGAQLAMKNALTMAHIHPIQLDYIHAHGTATPNNDVSEINAMTALFPKNPMARQKDDTDDGISMVTMPILFVSTKAFTGHTTSASGTIAMALTLLAMQKNCIPTNLNWRQVMPDGMRPNTQTVHQTVNNVLCNSFGFGGNDSSVLICRQPIDLPSNPATTEIVTLADIIVDENLDYRPYLSPLEARRMTPAMRSLVGAARQALSQTALDKVDAIITGTRYGCIVNTVQLLNMLTESGEDTFSPSLFMQSTHNTPSALLARLLQCHGYNSTYADDNEPYQKALLDATLQIQLGNANNVLVLAFDEHEPTWEQILKIAAIDYQPIIRATLIAKK